MMSVFKASELALPKLKLSESGQLQRQYVKYDRLWDWQTFTGNSSKDFLQLLNRSLN